MLYRVALLALVAGVAGQACTSSADAGTSSCACYGVPCMNITDEGTAVTLVTSNGPVIGRSTGTVDKYVGVPIGADGSGANRFKPPQPTSWTDAKETLVEKMCAQQQSQSNALVVVGTEDCLTVDLFIPTGAASMPVSYFVHGGGFTVNSPHFIGIQWGPFASYDYSELPNGGKSINVLIHYRLGAMGWMSHPGFIDPSSTAFAAFPGSNPGAGNYGLMDMLNGLSWVQTNAAAIGADPTKVTVFGESAGAASVMVLVASPLSQGLAASFIAESPFISFGAASYSMTARVEVNMMFTMRTGCSTDVTVPAPGTTAASDQASCLRGGGSVADADVMYYLMMDNNMGGSSVGAPYSDAAIAAFNGVYASVAAGAATIFGYNSINTWPVVDGFTMTMPPLEAYASGINAAATVVVGHNSDEYTTFCMGATFDYTTYSFVTDPNGAIAGAFFCEAAPDPYNEGYLLGIMYLDAEATFGEIAAGVTAVMAGTKIAQLTSGIYYDMYYADIVDNPAQMSVQMGTDAWFANGNNQAIEALLAAKDRPADTVYHFVFADETDPWLPFMGACHGCELTYVLGYWHTGGTMLSGIYGFPASPQTGFPTATQQVCATAMEKYWAALFYTASPNVAGSGLPTWTSDSVMEKNTMTFQGSFTYGALMNPCVRFTSCRTENAKDWRYALKHFWGSAPAAQGVAMPKCTSAPLGVLSKGFAGTLAYNCSFLPCCTYTSRSRNLLFGMPTATTSTACDAMC